MIPEIGQFALTLALWISLAGAVLGVGGAMRAQGAWIAVARPAAAGQLVFIVIAFACLTHAFVTNDFSVQYVVSHSNSRLPLPYRIAGVWGGHEGSLLLWMLMLSGWTAAVAAFSRRLPDDMVACVLGVMNLVSIGFIAFMLFTSNPFDRVFPAAMDGRDLNPLLQDPGMVFHPPMLYMGYVGFSVAFAFAISALISGRLDAAWARWSRPWTTAAWVFLTLGIALGSWWAYYELGWGGWWFWDPVENASFMPWLVGTALIHSLAVTEKRGVFRSWTVLLAIAAFALSLIGTFLVRSGVLTSVHAFATDPARGIFILGFVGVVIGGSLVLFAVRASRVSSGGVFELVSRETMLLLNNVMLVVAAAAVLLGTMYPLALDALGLGKISVGPPYFETVFVPLMAPALFLMGVGPLVRWKSARLPELAIRLRWAAGVSVIVALVLPAVSGRWSLGVSFGLLCATWIVASSITHLVQRVSASSSPKLLGKLRSPSLSFYGMLTAHIGIAVFVTGVTLVKGWGTEKDASMVPGESTELAGYAFRFGGVREFDGPNYTGIRGTVEVTRNGAPVVVLYPEKRMYLVQQNPMTEAAIDSGFTRDLYVALGDAASDQAWVVRIQHKPFVGWIWGGCLIMALGGALAIADRRYRLRAPAQDARPSVQAAPLAAAPGRS